MTRDFVIIEFVDSLGVPVDRTMTISSLATDSILVGTDLTSSTFELPLDPFNDNVMFTFNDRGVQNWLTVGYRNVVFINSEDCGPEIVYSELVLWGTSFDSVRVVDDRLFDGINRNVIVYDR